MSVRETAVFDFDGTITTRESQAEFLRFRLGSARLAAAVLALSPRLLGFRRGRVSRQELKEAFLARLLGGRPASEVAAWGVEFAAARLDTMLRPAAMERVSWHRDRGDRLVLASAALEVYLLPWAAGHGFDDVLASRLEVREGLVTGRLLGANCWGPEKVVRLRELLGDELEPDAIHAYGDSRGDRELLAAAGHPHYRAFG